MASNLSGRPRVGVFAKAPVAGFAKTRLIPALGAEGAAALQATLTRRALRTAAASGAEVWLWSAGDVDHPFWAELSAEGAPRRVAQQGDDLGARMAHALITMHAGEHPALIIGSDCPALTAAHLAAAITALDDHDQVFIPAEDGGYVLVGSRRPDAALFSAIDWGTDQVMAQTRVRLQARGAHHCELPALWDVDEPADWRRAHAEGLIS
ncbi:TIGR04282 family arsenosugar biosynthesis glycosyltransferase [Polycyclovorans algicola]|uniref:TIGR04282 family arsenosugar biosynthesis glycosyltransferase n=1 Tax=Polycyclovorans algicola TaxID=616992 RepID=UPI0004A6D745|nr:TIGR04282 family arsenosugar biosynthesis glycosyltransferase [Polycyclovorans algicola]